MLKMFVIKSLENLGKYNYIFYKASVKLRDRGWKEFFYKSIKVFNRNIKTEIKTRTVTNEDVCNFKNMPFRCSFEKVKKGTVAFTIVSKNYMQYALVLRESYLKYNPTSEFYIVLMDLFRKKEEIDLFRDIVAKGVKIIAASSIRNGVPYFRVEEMFFKYDILEMNTAIKPFFLEYFCNKGFLNVMYIDPDIYFTNSMDKLVEKLCDHDIILTPHAISPYPDGNNPDDLAILRAGSYNLGFIAIRNTQNSLKMCRWWEEKLFYLCKNNLPEGLFVDQKWMDLVPSMFDKVYIEKSQAYNVAYWNLHERKVYKDKNVWMVEGERLVFFHFSGMPIHNMDEISKHQNRYKLSDFPAMHNLFEEYKNKVLENGYDIFRQICNEYYYSYIPATNIKIPDMVRYTYCKDIFSDNANPYLAEMNSMNNLLKCIYGRDKGVSRFHQSIYLSREDLKKIFPRGLDDKKTRKEFIKWLEHSAKREYKMYSRVMNDEPIGKNEVSTNDGFHVVGYLKSVAGTSMVARSFYKILATTGIPYTNTVLANEAACVEDEYDKVYDLYNTDKPIFKTMIYFINADSIASLGEYYPHFFKDTYNIGVWWWEFDDYFLFDDAFKYVDEVVVMSDFVKTAIEKTKPNGVKLRKVTYPFIPDWQILSDRNSVRKNYNIGTDEYTYFFNFDYLSSFERKNPLGLLQAFAKFSINKNNVKLVLKTVNCNCDSYGKSSVEQFVKDNNLLDKVVFINDTLSRDEMITVINSMDCYVSLHRSEGLGVGMMEAMYLGLPVIATAYGGNMDFMNDENAFLVPYSKVAVKNDFGPYKAGWMWAEPDIDIAKKCMEDVYNDHNLAKEKGVNGQKTIMEQYSLLKVQKDIFDLFLHKDNDNVVKETI